MTLSTASGSPEEILRYALCALTHLSDESTQPVHIHRIVHLATKFGLKDDAVYILKSRLALLRECQDVGHGFWVPTPPRLVPLKTVHLVIAPNSTEELRYCVTDKIELAGLGRVLDLDQQCQLKTEPFNSWCRRTSPIKSWVEDIVDDVKLRLQPTLHPDGDIQAYCHWNSFKYRRNGSVTDRWLSLKESRSVGNAPVLCRRHLPSYDQFFFAKVKDGLVTDEAAIDAKIDINRLIHGMDLSNGNLCTIHYQKKNEGIHFTLPRFLPLEEYRALIALCHINSRQCSIKSRFFPDLQAVLEEIGYIWKEV